MTKTITLSIIFFTLGYITNEFFSSENMFGSKTYNVSSDSTRKQNSQENQYIHKNIIYSEQQKIERTDSTNHYSHSKKEKQYSLTDLSSAEEMSKLIDQLTYLDYSPQNYTELVDALVSLSPDKKKGLIQKLLEQKEDPTLRAFSVSILSTIAESDPEQAVSIFSSLTNDERETIDSSFIYQLAKADSGYTWHWLKTQNKENFNSVIPPNKLLSMQATVLHTMSQSKEHQAKALQYALDSEESKRSELLRVVTKQIGEHSPEHALNLADEISALNTQQQLAPVYASIIETSSRSTPLKALDILTTRPEFENESTRYFVSKGLAENLSNAELEELSSTLANSQFYDELLEQAALHYTYQDIEITKKWINRIQDSQKKQRLVFTVVHKIHEHYPERDLEQIFLSLGVTP